MKPASSKYLILSAFIISITYWIYLAFHTSMIIIYDSVGYEQLGRMLMQDGWLAYFATGPNREPFYPLLVSFAMRIAEPFSSNYQTVLTWLQIFILFLTQLLTYNLLKRLKVHNVIIMIAILYVGLSPALVNSALSLYSEIAAYPFILSLILISSFAWQAVLEQKGKKVIMLGIALGFLMTVLTLTKGVFEIIVPLFVAPFLILALRNFRKPGKKIFLNATSLLLTVLVIFYGSIFIYKSLNKTYNGQFVLTNRGSWALYGNTARRMEELSAKRFLVALAYMPGEGVCKKIFDEDECTAWSYQRSDHLGFSKLKELETKNFSPEKINRKLIRLSFKEAGKNPLQYALFCGMEMLKMLFWESTKIGFVNYPVWLTKIFDFTPFKNGLRLLVFLLTIISLAFTTKALWRNRLQLSQPEEDNFHLLFFVVFIIYLFIGIHAPFFTLTRYSLPIAPLFILAISFSCDRLIRSESIISPN